MGFLRNVITVLLNETCVLGNVTFHCLFCIIIEAMPTSRTQYTNSLDNDFVDESSIISQVDKRSFLTFVGLLATAGTTVAATIYGYNHTAAANDDFLQMAADTSSDISNIDHMIQQQRALIKDEQALWSAFVEDSGVLDFGMAVDGHQFSAGQSPKTHMWSDYLDFCRIANGTLASPMNAEQFAAISTIASKKGKCYLGPSKQSDGVNWKTPDNVAVSLTRYWAKNQPNDLAIDFLCSFIFNDGKDSYLYSGSCGGDNPVMKCFICAKKAK